VVVVTESKVVRRLAVSSIAWLDFGAALTDEFVVEIAFAVDNLSPAIWTALNFAAEDVKLSFVHAAIVAWLLICSPILALIAIPNALNSLAADGERGLNGFVGHGTTNLTRSRPNYSAIKGGIIRCIKLALLGSGGKITEHANQHIGNAPPVAIPISSGQPADKTPHSFAQR
jgi:hypothetical protein